MISKSDWRSVDQEWMDDERRRVKPPTSDELTAYSRGELSPEDEERVREQLAAYPELVGALAEPFPTEGAEPGDPDYVSDEQFAADWAAMQKRRTDGAKPRVIHFWRGLSALAATLAILLGVGWWRTLPRVVEPQLVGDGEVLLPDGGRGPETATIVHMSGDSIVLVTPLMGSQRFADYRLAIERVPENRRIWRSGIVHPGEDDNFAILIHRRFAGRGTYRVLVHGIAGGEERQIATYTVRIE